MKKLLVIINCIGIIFFHYSSIACADTDNKNDKYNLSRLFGEVFGISMGVSLFSWASNVPTEPYPVTLPDYLVKYDKFVNETPIVNSFLGGGPFDRISENVYLDESDLKNMRNYSSFMGGIILNYAQYDLLTGITSLIKSNKMKKRDYEVCIYITGLINAGYFGYRSLKIESTNYRKSIYTNLFYSSLFFMLIGDTTIPDPDDYMDYDLSKSSYTLNLSGDKEGVFKHYMLFAVEVLAVWYVFDLMTNELLGNIEAVPGFAGNPSLETFTFSNLYFVMGVGSTIGFIPIFKYLGMLPTVLFTDKTFNEILFYKDIAYTKNIYSLSLGATSAAFYFIGLSREDNLERRNSAYIISAFFGLTALKTLFDKKDKYQIYPVMNKDKVGVMASKQF